MLTKLVNQGGRALTVVLLRLFARVTSPVIRVIATKGWGSQEYLKRGSLPVPLHFYQPIFDGEQIPQAVWERAHDLPGVEWRPDEQLANLRELGRFASETAEWPEDAIPGQPARYWWSNGTFGYSSACLLHAIVRTHKPARVVEIGAGMSSLVIASALAVNARETDNRAEYTTIDPYPTAQVRSLAGGDRTLIESNAEAVPLEVFTSLGEGDLLFIDSSHVVRTGGDVNYLYLDVLPRVAPGVLVHIHDIHLPYEYPKSYSTRHDVPPLFWNEQYLLQALLVGNDHFRVVLGAYWIQSDYPGLFAQAFPSFRPNVHRLSTSFYLKRV